MGSMISEHRFEIYPGPVVHVKLNLKGPNMPADINQPTKDAFLKVFAALIGTPVQLASILSVKFERIFLLSMQLNIEVISNSEESAERVRRAITAADLNLALDDLGWHNVEINVVGSSSAASEGSFQQSMQKNTPLSLGVALKITQEKERRLGSPLIAGLLMGAGLVLGLGLAGFFVVRWKWKKTKVYPAALGIFPRNEDMYRANLDTCNIRPELWVREHEEYLRHRPLLGARVSLESQRQSDLDRHTQMGGSGTGCCSKVPPG